MIEGIPRISVYIITYNQEKVIHRTLASVLSQIDFVYEICVSDDHSTDKTWEILLDYSRRYPGLFKLNRNDPNLGIFENTEKVWTMPTGDIVHDLAGDDCVGDGWFKKVIDYISENNIDYKNELFCIYGDFKAIYPNGDSFIQTNKALLTGQSPLKLCIRGIICNRSTCYSVKLLRRFVKVSQGRSYIAEGAQDRQLQVWSEKNYYVPGVGNVYNTGIGVSTKITGERKEAHLARWDYLQTCLNNWGVNLEKKDKEFIEFRKSIEKGSKISAFFHFIKSFDISLGLMNFQFRRMIFAIIRRLPHKKPIMEFRAG